jgi:hypothetical protein
VVEKNDKKRGKVGRVLRAQSMKRSITTSILQSTKLRIILYTYISTRSRAIPTPPRPRTQYAVNMPDNPF